MSNIFVKIVLWLVFVLVIYFLVYKSIRFFDPANTTYQKHWQLESSTITHSETAVRLQCSGYFNTTSAVNAINFKCNSGNIIHGDFCLYGIN